MSSGQQKEQFKIRLNSLKLTNFKIFDKLEIKFPKPVLADDPDIFVMGSQNGLGKTSVLEAIALLGLFVFYHKINFNSAWSSFSYSPINCYDFFIKAGEDELQVNAIFNFQEELSTIDFGLLRGGGFLQGNCNVPEDFKVERRDFGMSETSMRKTINALLANISDPLILPHFMYFHSNRRIELGNTENKAVFNSSNEASQETSTVSQFKIEMLKVLMSKSGLVENVSVPDAELVYEKLNDLIKQYAGGTVEKLRSDAQGRFELTVKPVDGGPSYNFNALSSGQKEIISTLFLIWKHTKDQPGIVLIDEPELHLNAEWQMKFIHTLHKLAPQNQYIMATHSEHIFSSVEKSQRVILRLDDKKRGCQE